MSIFNFIKGEFLEVISWEDDSQDTMVYKFPVPEKQQIKEGAQLIVRPSQVAVFVYQGQIADVYEPGKYTLDTDTTPVLTTLSNWKYLFNNHFKTDVYFINTKQFINQKWGTSNPVTMRDVDFGLVRLRAFGVYSFRVTEPVTFLKEVFGTNKMFTVESVNEHLKSAVVSGLSEALGESKIAAVELAASYNELGKLVQERLQERFGLLGLGVSDFILENVSLPEEVEKAIDKRSQMGALGNLDNYMKYQTAEAVLAAAQNEGGGMAGMGAGMGAGVGIGQAMAQAMQPQQQPVQQPVQQAAPAAATVACAKCNAPMLATAKFCGQCGTPVATGCPNCNAALQPGSKFCAACGHKLA